MMAWHCLERDCVAPASGIQCSSIGEAIHNNFGLNRPHLGHKLHKRLEGGGSNTTYNKLSRDDNNAIVCTLKSGWHWSGMIGQHICYSLGCWEYDFDLQHSTIKF